MSLCEECAKRFRPEHNPNAADGDFSWGWMAWEAFERAIPDDDRKRQVITVPDENPNDPAEARELILPLGFGL